MSAAKSLLRSLPGKISFAGWSKLRLVTMSQLTATARSATRMCRSDMDEDEEMKAATAAFDLRRKQRAAMQRGINAGNRENVRATCKKWRASHSEQIKEYDKAYREENPQKIKARSIVTNALAAGKLVRGVCEVCGISPAEAHHDDYAKPLEIRWLCK